MTVSKIPGVQGASHKWPDCFVWSFPWRPQCVKRPCLFKASTGILLLKIVLQFSESLASFCAALTWDSSLFTVMHDGTCLLVDRVAHHFAPPPHMSHRLSPPPSLITGRNFHFGDRSTCAFSGKFLRIDQGWKEWGFARRALLGVAGPLPWDQPPKG